MHATSYLYHISGEKMIKATAYPERSYRASSRHGGHIGILKQWNGGGHDGVLNKSCGSWTLFLCKQFLLFAQICIDAGHVSENSLYLISHSKIYTQFHTKGVTNHSLWRRTYLYRLYSACMEISRTWGPGKNARYCSSVALGDCTGNQN